MYGHTNCNMQLIAIIFLFTTILVCDHNYFSFYYFFYAREVKKATVKIFIIIIVFACVFKLIVINCTKNMCSQNDDNKCSDNPMSSLSTIDFKFHPSSMHDKLILLFILGMCDPKIIIINIPINQGCHRKNIVLLFSQKNCFLCSTFPI